MEKVKLNCTFEEMRAIVRALHNYKCELQDKSQNIPENWFKEDSAGDVADMMARLVWENSAWKE